MSGSSTVKIEWVPGLVFGVTYMAPDYPLFDGVVSFMFGPVAVNVTVKRVGET